jgi:all-trans-8'-apo-beta-carotenal 15,15'-oxygenase
MWPCILALARAPTRLHELSVRQRPRCICRAWLAPYKHSVTEHPKPIVILVHGRLPEGLKGVYYRNGPGCFKSCGHLKHPFDADGAVCSVTLDDLGATFRMRFVETEGYVPATSSWDILLFAGPGTVLPVAAPVSMHS